MTGLNIASDQLGSVIGIHIGVVFFPQHFMNPLAKLGKLQKSARQKSKVSLVNCENMTKNKQKNFYGQTIDNFSYSPIVS